MFQKRLRYSMKKGEKKRKKEKQKKEDKCPTQNKERLAAQVFLKVFKFLREVYEISQRS
jgi:hypothetical protein